MAYKPYRYNIYQTKDKKDFEWMDGENTEIQARATLSKLIDRVVDPDPNEATFKNESLILYIFKGKDNVSGKMVFSVTLTIKNYG